MPAKNIIHQEISQQHGQLEHNNKGVTDTSVQVLEIMQNKSCVTEDGCHLKFKTTSFLNRNYEQLPKHLHAILPHS